MSKSTLALAFTAVLFTTAESQADTIIAEFGTRDLTLYVTGTESDDLISVSRNGDAIEVNGGRVPIVGGSPTVSIVLGIVVDGLGGNDRIELDQWDGPLPDAELVGGEGNDLLIGGDGVDVLRGGAGNDVLLGGRGNDEIYGQDGSDLLIWNNGDGSDFMEGGAGFDFVQVNGSNTAGDAFSVEPVVVIEGGEGFDFVQVNGANDAGDDFSIDPDPGDDTRTRFRRNNLGLFTLDIGTTENLDVNGQGGSDVIIGSTGLNGLWQLHLDGGEGDDRLVGSGGPDLLDGGEGTDSCFGSGGRDELLNCEIRGKH